MKDFSRFQNSCYTGFFKKRKKITSSVVHDNDSDCIETQTTFDSEEAEGVVETFEELRKHTLTAKGVDPTKSLVNTTVDYCNMLVLYVGCGNRSMLMGK